MNFENSKTSDPQILKRLNQSYGQKRLEKKI